MTETLNDRQNFLLSIAEPSVRLLRDTYVQNGLNMTISDLMMLGYVETQNGVPFLTDQGKQMYQTFIDSQ